MRGNKVLAVKAGMGVDAGKHYAGAPYREVAHGYLREVLPVHGPEDVPGLSDTGREDLHAQTADLLVRREPEFHASAAAPSRGYRGEDPRIRRAGKAAPAYPGPRRYRAEHSEGSVRGRGTLA